MEAVLGESKGVVAHNKRVLDLDPLHASGAGDEEDGSTVTSDKRARTDEHHPLHKEVAALLGLAAVGAGGAWVGALPHIGMDGEAHARLATIFQEAGMRTALISAPHRAVSVYLGGEQPEGAGPVWLLLGMHKRQAQLEEIYRTEFKHRYWAMLFARRVRETLGPSLPEAVRAHALAVERGDMHGSVEPQVQSLMTAVVGASGVQVQPEALEKEYRRIQWRNSTLSNALMQCFLAETGITLADVVLRPSTVPGSTRMTLTLWEDSPGARRPDTFTFLPGLPTVIAAGVDALVQEMVEGFWAQVWCFGYFPSRAFKAAISDQMAAFFRSGLVRSGGRVALAAGFEPQHHFSLYLHGLAGAGKSSFVSKLVPALAATIETFADPEMDVRFVKQVRPQA
jgi:hypothetical protein